MVLRSMKVLAVVYEDRQFCTFMLGEKFTPKSRIHNLWRKLDADKKTATAF